MATSPNLRPVVALILLVALTPHVESASCGGVISKLAPCATYAAGGESMPSSACCSGIDGINKMASTTEARRAVCNCLKSFASNVNGVGLDRVKGLPGKCGVSVPYPISPSTDCDT